MSEEKAKSQSTQEKQKQALRIAGRNHRLTTYVTVGLAGIAFLGLECVVYSLSGRAGSPTNWIMGGNALIFSGMTGLLILLNFGVSRANQSMAQTQELQALLSVNPVVFVVFNSVMVDDRAVPQRALLQNNSSAPAHAALLKVWPVVRKEEAPGWEIQAGYESFPIEIIPYALQEVRFRPRQPVTGVEEDVIEGTWVADDLCNQGCAPYPEMFVARLDWLNALGEERGRHSLLMGVVEETIRSISDVPCPE